MSQTDAFVFPRLFPFCASNTTGAHNYVDNLDLEDVMAFFWNLENFDLTLTGTVTALGHTRDMSGTLTLNPAGFSGSLWDEIRCPGYGDAWYGSAFDWVEFASAPDVRTPRERICASADAEYALQIELRNSTDGGVQDAWIDFWIGTDPNNSGKYRLNYSFYAYAVPEGGEYGGEMAFASERDYITDGGLTLITDGGTFTIGGITFTYYSGYTGDSYTGGTMSASSSNYSYP
jgi:hypothetical protein